MKINEQNKIYRLLGITLFFIVSFLWMYLSDKNTEEIRKHEDEIYPEIVNIQAAISEKIFSLKPSTVWNGALLVMLKDSSTFSLSKLAYNWDY